HTRSKRDWSSDVCSSDLIFFAKQLEESFGIAASKPEREAGKNHGAGRRMKAFDVAARIEEGVEQGAIGGEERASAFAKLLKMVEIGRASCRERVRGEGEG